MTQSWREAASAAMDLLLKLAEEHAQPERAQAAIAAPSRWLGPAAIGRLWGFGSMEVSAAGKASTNRYWPR